MFDIGFSEMILIAIIAILFLGPDKLPEAMVKIAKFMKSVKKAVSDAKNSLEEEMKIADLKEEALSYKKQLDAATHELQGFKNIGINPVDDLNDALSSAKHSLSSATDEAKKETATTQVEPKRETITFEKQKPKIDEKPQSKGGEA